MIRDGWRAIKNTLSDKIDRDKFEDSFLSLEMWIHEIKIVFIKRFSYKSA